MQLERLQEDDLVSLSLLYQQLVPHEPRLTEMREAFRKAQDNPNHLLIGAKENGKLIGSLVGIVCETLFGRCRPFVVVEDVVVDTDHHRKGVGKALMAEIEGFALDRECSYIILLTDSDRPEAQHFYEALGYKSEPYRGFKKTLSSNA